MAKQSAVLGVPRPVPDDRDQAGDRLGPVERDQVGRADSVHERLDRAAVPGSEMLGQIHICELMDRAPTAGTPTGRDRARPGIFDLP
jgi:hypothetical protein